MNSDGAAGHMMVAGCTSGDGSGGMGVIFVEHLSGITNIIQTIVGMGGIVVEAGNG